MSRILLATAVMSLFLIACSESKPEIEQSREITHSAPAELISLDEVTIGPPSVSRMWRYKIKYLAPENRLIKKGDVVVTFDDQELKNQLISRSSRLEAAKKEAEKKKLRDEQIEQDLILALAEAKKNSEIAQRRAEITDVSLSAIEKAKEKADFQIATERYQQAQQKLTTHRERIKINHQVSQANIANEQVRVDILKQGIKKLVIRSPKDGMVIYLERRGNKPSEGDTVWMGHTLLALPSIDKIAVKVEFDESDSAKVAIGKPVKLILDAYPERPFPGQISTLGKVYREKSARNPRIVFDARVTLDEMDLELMKPGMKGVVKLSAGGRQ